MNATQACKQFLNTLKAERNYSNHTISNYRRDILRFLEYISQVGKDWSQLEEIQVLNYLAARHTSGIKGKTLARELSSLRHFFRYCKTQGYNCNYPLTASRHLAIKRSCPIRSALTKSRNYSGKAKAIVRHC